MHKQFKLMILVNILLSLLFFFSNFSIWAELNSDPTVLRSVVFTPFSITDSHAGSVVNGNQFIPLSGIVGMLNFPFLLFFIAIAVNISFIFRLQRSKETK
jgi:hypothetical protein